MRRDELVDGAWYLVETDNRFPYRAMTYSVEDGCFIDHNAECYVINEMIRWARINPEEIFNGRPE